MKIIKQLFIRLLWASFSVWCMLFIPRMWDVAGSSLNSMTAKLYYVAILGLLIPTFITVFILILDYEELYKRTHTYDPFTRKWRRNA